VYVHGLREVEVRSLPEALCVLDRGQRHRMVAETQLNRGSSRSHAVLTIKLVKPGTDKDRDGIVAKMSIVDLAGAERSDRTGNTGKRAREAIKINTSLMQLGRCLEVLRQNQLRPQHPQPVPFRDSNVTRLFQDYLTGYGRTVMLTTVSGAQADFDETAHALRYAAIAREIKVQLGCFFHRFFCLS
jgi:kinesin family protein 20